MSKVKDPDAELPYAVDWTTFMSGLDGDEISTATILADADLTIEDEGVTANVHAMMIAGGTPGKRYVVTSRIATVAGVDQDQSFQLWITET